MNFSKVPTIRIILIIAIAIITSVIFLNSFEDFTASHHSSEAVMNVVSPNSSTINSHMEMLFRKIAHVIEYAVLGVAVMSFVIIIKRQTSKSFFGISLFYVLAAAVLDEHIQTFSDRTSSTNDILLDFLGAIIGFVVVLAIYFIIKKVNKKTTDV